MNSGFAFSRDGRCGKRSSATSKTLRSILVAAAIAVGTLLAGPVARADDLFIGDVGDNTVKQFDSATGNFITTFVPSGADGLNGPMGMIFTNGQLLLVNQNFGNAAGEVLRFEANGTFINKLFSSTDRDAAYAPQGIVRGAPDNRVYVADIGTQGNKCNSEGNIKLYDDAGAFLGNLDRSGFKPGFYPRGIVFGPDGLLYVAARGCPLSKNSHDALVAYVLRFDPYSRKFLNVFASDQTVAGFHRPVGLVFDKTGNLWITSFRDTGNPTDVDRILKLDGKTGLLLDSIPLSDPGATRFYAEAILFGPDGKLFVPTITGIPPNPPKGELRRCDTGTKHCDTLVTTGGQLKAPWFLIFRSSNPATLNYQGQ
jgi:DNA-binding beta-propeller fold protein YncE